MDYGYPELQNILQLTAFKYNKPSYTKSQIKVRSGYLYEVTTETQSSYWPGPQILSIKFSCGFPTFAMLPRTISPSTEFLKSESIKAKVQLKHYSCHPALVL